MQAQFLALVVFAPGGAGRNDFPLRSKLRRGVRHLWGAGMIEAVELLICLQRLATPEDAERSRSSASSTAAKFVLWKKVQGLLDRKEGSFRGRIERHGPVSSKSSPTQTTEPS